VEYAQLVLLAKTVAKRHVLDPALICAIVEQESDWQTFSIRYEPAFQKRYVDPLNLGNYTEVMARSTSWGLMQLMGQCAREMGFSDKIASLCDPFTGLEWGCKHFARKYDAANADVQKALLLWNGGGNAQYPQQVLDRVNKYY